MQDARVLLQGPATQQSIEQMAAIGQAEHWAPWHPGTPWGTTKVVNGVVIQTSEEASSEAAKDAATLTPDQQANVQTALAAETAAQQATAAQVAALEAATPVIQP
jgi:hypothetical protein